jgi:hypothetical protein
MITTTLSGLVVFAAQIEACRLPAGHLDMPLGKCTVAGSWVLDLFCEQFLVVNYLTSQRQ